MSKMRRLLIVSLLLSWTLSLNASEPDARSILLDVAAQYRNSKSFRIEFETKITSSSTFANGWSKQTHKVAADENKYYFEADGSSGRHIRVNDGESDWFYSPSAHQYSVQSPDGNPRSAVNGTAEGWIKATIHSLLTLDQDADGAVMQHDEVLRIGGSRIPCYVVRTIREMSFREGTNSVHENTYWIDKTSRRVRKAVLVSRGPTAMEDDESDKTRTVEITYTRVDLDAPPDQALFRFKPPADAYLIDDARPPVSPPVAIGRFAPGLKFNDKAGRSFDLAELKGRVVLVDFWASWCGACLEEMKLIAQLPQSYLSHGLVIVSLDEDETPERGDSYFSAQQFHWRNFHDVGEVYRRRWGASAVPMAVLVDRDGKVAWTSNGVGANFSETLHSQLDNPELLLKAQGRDEQ
jgi:thiol-disulfide isomerase/thioredoxin